MFTNVLLINPPDSGQGASTAAPLGLMYIATVLQKHHIQVNILDAFLDGWDSVLSKTRECQPDMVGIACPTYARVAALKIAKMVKAEFPDTIVLLGGFHPTLMGRQVLEHYSFVDMICAGEGEYLVLELCQGKALENILGLGFRKEKQVVINKTRSNITNLDELPLPAWELVDPLRYKTNNEVVYNGIDFSKEVGAGISFSRGCIGRCNFCSNINMWKKWKHRSPKNVVDEIEMLNRNYNIRCFQFNDDCFSVHKQATLELCDEILKRDLKIYFNIVTRTDCVDEELLKALKGAGCYMVCFGIETASPKLLKILHKSIKLEVSANAIKLVNAAGLRSYALIIAGCLGENWETINETIDFLNDAEPTNMGVANGLMIFPGTELYDIAKKQKVIDDDFWLSDYNWKIYTKENSKMMLNIFTAAIHSRVKLSRFAIVNFFRYHKFVSKEVENFVKSRLEWAGIRIAKRNKLKPKTDY